jgi:predicted transcriptional regulator
MRKIMSKEPKQQDKSTTGSLVEDIKENFGIDVEKIAETVVKNYRYREDHRNSRQELHEKVVLGKLGAVGKR